MMPKLLRFTAPASLSFLICLLFGPNFLAKTVHAAEAAPRAAVFTDRLPGQDEEFAREIGAQVSAAGYAVEFIGVSVLTNTEGLSAGKFDLLVLTGARSLPASAVPAIEGYLKRGGDLLALGLPAWESPLFELDGRWLSRAGFNEALAALRPEKWIFDFALADLKAWNRTSDNSANRARHEVVAEDRGRALHVAIEKLTGWDTYQSPVLTNAFPAGQTLTCFRARGTEHTRQLALEWTERDGSRDDAGRRGGAADAARPLAARVGDRRQRGRDRGLRPGGAR